MLRVTGISGPVNATNLIWLFWLFQTHLLEIITEEKREKQSTNYLKILGLSHYKFARKISVAPYTIINWRNDKIKNVEKKIHPNLDGPVEFDQVDEVKTTHDFRHTLCTVETLYPRSTPLGEEKG